MSHTFSAFGDVSIPTALSGSDFTLVYVDTDADTAIEFQIRLTGLARQQSIQLRARRVHFGHVDPVAAPTGKYAGLEPKWGVPW